MLTSLASHLRPLVLNTRTFNINKPLLCARAFSGQKEISSAIISLLNTQSTPLVGAQPSQEPTADEHTFSAELLDKDRIRPYVYESDGVKEIGLGQEEEISLTVRDDAGDEDPYEYYGEADGQGGVGSFTQRKLPPAKDMMKELKYFQYYPSRIQKWVSYARMPKGRYDENGYWEKDRHLMAIEAEKRDSLIDLGRRMQNQKSAVEERERFIQDNPLPQDLVGKYRFGVLPEETVNLSPKFKEWLTYRHANNYEINALRKTEAIKKWQQKPYDTGTTAVQIAVITTRIEYLTKHVAKHKSDIKTRLGLRDLINKRFRLMKYCKRKNVPLYYELIKELNIRDTAP